MPWAMKCPTLGKPIGELTPPRTTASYRLIPRNGYCLTPTLPHIGFQGGDPIPGLLQLRLEPFQFGQELLAIRIGGLNSHSSL
jgi:hypothetical protein